MMKEQFREDSLPLGLILGVLLPLLVFGILMFLNSTIGGGTEAAEGFSDTFRKRTIALLAICANLIPFMIFNKKRKYNGMRGIIIPTVMYVFAWVFYFKDSIL